MSYRVEVAKTGRALCQATHCKKEGTKIEKGELRQGTLATIGEHTTMKYRHWGCVTPKVISNWKESSGMDMELVDGYDELPKAEQVKVMRALEQGHVDDEDWNGDIEMNRFNPDKPMQGMFIKTPKKKKGEDDSDNVEESPAKKQATKKRGRAKADDDEDGAEPAPKKAKGKTKKVAKADNVDDVEPEQAAPPQKAKKGKKAKAEDADNADPEPVPAPKKGRAKKAKSAATIDPLEDEASPVEEAPPKKTGAKKRTAKPVKAVVDEPDVPKTQPQKSQRKGKKATASED